MSRLEHAIGHRRGDRGHGLLNMRKGIVMLHMRQGMLGWQRVLSDMRRCLFIVVLVIVIIAATTFVFEV